MSAISGKYFFIGFLKSFKLINSDVSTHNWISILNARFELSHRWFEYVLLYLSHDGPLVPVFRSDGFNRDSRRMFCPLRIRIQDITKNPRVQL